MSNWFKFYGGDYLTDPKMKRLTPTEKAMWVALLCYASNSDDGVISFLTEDDLRDIVGVSELSDDWERTQGAFDRFIALGLMEQKESKILIVNFEKRQTANATDAERALRYRLKKKSGDEHHEPVTKSSRSAVTKVTLEREGERDKKESHTTRDGARDESNATKLFDTFWELYPNKKSKKKAVDAWSKLFKNVGGEQRGDLYDKIIAGLMLSRASQQWQKDGGQFVPHPTTWLNQERWNDEVAILTTTERKVHKI